jgi:hypothetical protein
MKFCSQHCPKEIYGSKIRSKVVKEKLYCEKNHSFFYLLRFRFVEGMLNICYNAIDRHIENGQGDKIAIIYDSPVTDTKATISYKEVLEQVIS